MFKIEDWAGNRMWPDKTFNTFEDGWEHIRTNVKDENDWQEYYVVPNK